MLLVGLYERVFTVGNGVKPTSGRTCRVRPPSAITTVAVVAAMLPNHVLAHGDAPTGTHDLWRAWSLEPLVMVGLAVATWAFFSGRAELRHRIGSNQAVSHLRASSYAAGMFVLAAALISPLDRFGDALFAAHMAQHLLLIVVAPPLLLLSRPLAPVLWALPHNWRKTLAGRWRGAALPRGGWRLLTRPAVAWAVHVVTIWAWHLPGPYQAAVERDLVHSLEHATFLGTAGLFWWTILGSPARHAGPAPILSLFAMGVQSSALGALLTFSESPWYPIYEATAATWGLSPLADQQLAGLIMWVPAGAVYLAAALAVFGRWLAESEREAVARERLAASRQGEVGA